MKYSTVVVAAFVVTGLLFAGAMTGTASHEDEIGGSDTFVLEIGHIGGPGETCVYDEGPHMNRVEVSGGELEDVSIYHEGEDAMQLNIPQLNLGTVLWTDGSNPAVEQAATTNGTCVSNDLDNVTVNVLYLQTDLETPEGIEILTGDDVEEAPPPSAVFDLPDEDDLNNTDEVINDTTDNITDVNGTTDDVEDTVNNTTDEPLNDTVGNLTDINVSDVDNLTDDVLNATDDPIDPADVLITQVFENAGEAIADDETVSDDTTTNEASEGETTTGS